MPRQLLVLVRLVFPESAESAKSALCGGGCGSRGAVVAGLRSAPCSALQSSCPFDVHTVRIRPLLYERR